MLAPHGVAGSVVGPDDDPDKLLVLLDCQRPSSPPKRILAVDLKFVSKG